MTNLSTLIPQPGSQDECMEGCANRECLEELGVRVEAPLERALWEAEWKHRPYFPQSNILYNPQTQNSVSQHFPRSTVLYTPKP